jgi:hypothetical protein
MKTGNYIAAAFLLALCGFVWYLTLDFPGSHGNIPGPAFFPRGLALVLAALTLLMLYTNRNMSSQESLFDFKGPGVKRALVMLVVTVAYSFLLNLFGFILLTPICLMIMMWIMEPGKIVTKLIASVVTTGLLYLVFEVGLDVPLPIWSF